MSIMYDMQNTENEEFVLFYLTFPKKNPQRGVQFDSLRRLIEYRKVTGIILVSS